VEEKREIAAKALKVIKEESVIFLDHSSTCVYLARALAEKNPPQLVLFTNSVKILDDLEGRFPLNVVSTGGTLQHRWNALTGPYVIDFLSRVNFHQAFISCGAISPTRGLMTSFLFVAEILRKAKQVTQEVNLLVDSSKFNKLGAFSVMPITDVDRIITDGNLAPEIVSQYQDAGVEVVI
jgi:DeoR/GlpR family transcriptional regulator of sugar metabolism